MRFYWRSRWGGQHFYVWGGSGAAVSVTSGSRHPYQPILTLGRMMGR